MGWKLNNLVIICICVLKREYINIKVSKKTCGVVGLSINFLKPQLPSEPEEEEHNGLLPKNIQIPKKEMIIVILFVLFRCIKNNDANIKSTF